MRIFYCPEITIQKKHDFIKENTPLKIQLK